MLADVGHCTESSNVHANCWLQWWCTEMTRNNLLGTLLQRLPNVTQLCTEFLVRYLHRKTTSSNNLSLRNTSNPTHRKICSSSSELTKDNVKSHTIESPRLDRAAREKKESASSLQHCHSNIDAFKSFTMLSNLPAKNTSAAAAGP